MPSTSAPSSFDIYKEYLTFRRQPLPPALAAVGALGASLQQHPVQTISETLDLLSTLSESLKKQTTNPTIIAAGTDTFQRYLATALARPTQPSKSSRGAETPQDISLATDFQVTKAAIVRAAEQYVKRGLEARNRAWAVGRRFLKHGTTVVVSHPSDAVAGFLRDAATAGVRFRALLIRPSHRKFLTRSDQKESGKDDSTSYALLAASLKEAEVPYAYIEPAEMAHAITTLPRDAQIDGLPGAARSTLVLSGAGALLSTGGILAEVGTQQAACVAHSLDLEFWVVAEGYKVVHWDALKSSELRSVSFEPTQEKSGPAEGNEAGLWELGLMDVTPPKLVTGLVTEFGPQSTSAVAEEAIRIWF